LEQHTTHIAVMRLSAMGDVAMTVPVIRALVTQYPQVKITIVSRPFFKPFFDTIPNVSFFAFDDKKRHKGFFGLFRLFSDLRKLNITAFADLHNVLRSKIVRQLFRFSGKKCASVDKGRAEKKALTRAENKVFAPLTSMFERHVKVFKQLGFEVNIQNPSFPAPSVLDPVVLKLVGEKHGQKWIGIAPFAQYSSKVYPLDLMQIVVDELSKIPNYKLFLFGGGATEIALLDSLSKNKENVITVAGKIKFPQELKLISNLDKMLSMDSGNAHIAALLGVNTITLWGATHPFAGFAPFNQPLANALTSDRTQFPKLPTSVYGNKEVEGYENAMRSISPQDIIAKLS
jgi:ADP-heptose:LPS heptosyltransferase